MIEKYFVQKGLVKTDGEKQEIVTGRWTRLSLEDDNKLDPQCKEIEIRKYTYTIDENTTGYYFVDNRFVVGETINPDFWEEVTVQQTKGKSMERSDLYDEEFTVKENSMEIYTAIVEVIKNNNRKEALPKIKKIDPTLTMQDCGSFYSVITAGLKTMSN